MTEITSVWSIPGGFVVPVKDAEADPKDRVSSKSPANSFPGSLLASAGKRLDKTMHSSSRR